MIHSPYKRTRAVDLHYKVEGTGIPLVILHGLLGSGDNWRRVSRHLSAYYRVFTVDLRNHGQSPHNDVLDYEAMSDDLFEFSKRRDLQSCFLLGHSMGGKVAMQFATNYPDLVAKLIVVDITPKPYPAAHRQLLDSLGLLDLTTFQSFSEVDAALSTSISETAVRGFLLKNLTRDRNRGLRWKINLPAITRNYDKLGQAIVPGQKFAKPACFIRGARSSYIDESDLKKIRETFPQAELRTVTNAGHWVHVDNEVEFLNSVKDFLGRE